MVSCNKYWKQVYPTCIGIEPQMVDISSNTCEKTYRPCHFHTNKLSQYNHMPKALLEIHRQCPYYISGHFILTYINTLTSTRGVEQQHLFANT